MKNPSIRKFLRKNFAKYFSHWLFIAFLNPILQFLCNAVCDHTSVMLWCHFTWFPKSKQCHNSDFCSWGSQSKTSWQSKLWEDVAIVLASRVSSFLFLFFFFFGLSGSYLGQAAQRERYSVFYSFKNFHCPCCFHGNWWINCFRGSFQSNNN